MSLFHLVFKEEEVLPSPNTRANLLRNRLFLRSPPPHYKAIVGDTFQMQILTPERR